MESREVIVFLGPSLPHDRARQIFPEAQYRPPAKKGDLLRLAAAAAASSGKNKTTMMVGLVDGVFLQDYPPTPIEVYQLARMEGVTLAGAASLGALRAVELEKFGMVGIGRVFQLYKSGKINADDEVAVTFAGGDGGSGDFRLQSEAMIDIRYNLFLAHRKGVIGQKAKRVLASVAKGIYFPHRNYLDIAEEARRRAPGLQQEIDHFSSYIKSNRKSLKEMDAIQLLKYFKARTENGHRQK
jgi:hypothetical protein